MINLHDAIHILYISHNRYNEISEVNEEEEATKNSKQSQIRKILLDIVHVDAIVDIIFEYNPIIDGYCLTFYGPSTHRNKDKDGKFYNPCYINVNTKSDEALFIGVRGEHTDWFIQGKYPQSVKKIQASGYHMQTFHGINDDDCDIKIKCYDQFKDCINTHHFENIETDGDRYFYKYDKRCAGYRFIPDDIYAKGYTGSQFYGVDIVKSCYGYKGQLTYNI